MMITIEARAKANVARARAKAKVSEAGNARTGLAPVSHAHLRLLKATKVGNADAPSTGTNGILGTRTTAGTFI